MPDAQHRDAPLGQVHRVHNWQVATQAAREGLALTSADVGKVCMQTDTVPSTFWLLARVTGGVSWINLGAQGMTDEQAAQLNDALARATALGGQTYIVQTVTSDLTSERALDVGANLSIDWSQPGKVVIDGPAPAPAGAPPAAQYVVAAVNGSLANARLIEGSGPLSVSFATAGKVVLAVATALGGGAPAPGLMSAADKVAHDANTTKLAGIAAGATVGPAVPTVTPLQLADSVGSLGATGKYATEQHVHPHGNRAGGTLHATALGGGAPAAGFMSGADKVAHDNHVSYIASIPGLLAVKASVDFENVYWTSGTTRQITLADRNKRIICQVVTGPLYLTIPRDSTLNLPDGFVCQLWGDVIGGSPEWGVDIQSEVMNAGTLGLGIPMRIANGGLYTVNAAPFVTRIGPGYLATITKLYADRWMISGHYVAA